MNLSSGVAVKHAFDHLISFIFFSIEIFTILTVKKNRYIFIGKFPPGFRISLHQI